MEVRIVRARPRIGKAQFAQDPLRGRVARNPARPHGPGLPREVKRKKAMGRLGHKTLAPSSLLEPIAKVRLVIAQREAHDAQRRARMGDEAGIAAAMEVDDAIRDVLETASDQGRPVIMLPNAASQAAPNLASIRAMRILEDAVDTAIALSEQFGARELPAALAGVFLSELGSLRGGMPDAEALIHLIDGQEMTMAHAALPDPETGVLH